MLSKKTECHFKNNKKKQHTGQVLPANLRVSETLHVVFASSWPSSLLWLLVIIAVIGLTFRAWWTVLQFGAHITVTVIGLSLKAKRATYWAAAFFPPQFSVTLMCNSDIIHNIYSVTRLWVHTIKGDAGKIMEMQNIMQRKCRHKANAKSKTRQSKTVIIITLSAAPFKDHHRRSPASISPYP